MSPTVIKDIYNNKEEEPKPENKKACSIRIKLAFPFTIEFPRDKGPDSYQMD